MSADSLVAFLEARIQDDEQAAQRAAKFRYDDPGDSPWERARASVARGVALSSEPHIARWDPARVLREVEARRRIIYLHTGQHECSQYDTHGDVDNCTWNEGGDCSTLRLLALPFESHPDYDENWRP